jgi:hypothetical protein
MKVIYSLVIVYMIFVNCLAADANMITGSGKVISQTRKVSNFTDIELQGAFSVQIVRSDETKIKIDCDDNIVGIIRAEVAKGKLRIYSTKSYSTKTPIRLVISAPNITAVESSGSNTVNLSSVESKDLLLVMAGSSAFSAQGKTDTLHATLSGGATLKAGRLLAGRVFLDISGAGDAEVFASDKLDVTVAGIGNVRYFGRPAISRSINGIAEIIPAID